MGKIFSLIMGFSTDSLNTRPLPTGFKLEEVGSGFSARFHHDGLWCTARLGDHFYRRCVDGVVLVNSWPDASITSIFIQQQIQQVCAQLLMATSIDVFCAELLHRVLSVDSVQLLQGSKLYRDLFPEGVPVLPPDRYRDYVIPVTTGCPNGRCTFCAFYRNRPLRMLKPEEKGAGYSRYFSSIQHLQGEGRSGLFLGSANALALPGQALVEWLQQIKQHFGHFPQGVACFADADHVSRTNRESLCRFSELGLKFVVLGLETGSSQLRGSLNKKPDISPTADIVVELNKAGIAVGLTVLTGFMDAVQFTRHLTETVATINTMGLTTRDRVYVSPWFADDAVAPDMRAIDEMNTMVAELRKITAARVTGYSAHNFFYFT